MKILLLYHFFYPDDVVSARIFADLAEGLARSGHQVTVFTGKWTFRAGEALPPHEMWNDIEIFRFCRPNFSQKSNLGRLLNSLVMQLKWLHGFRKWGRDFDVALLGTDPQFGYLIFPWLRLMSRRIRLVHWVFDVFPEAILVQDRWWMRVPAALCKPLTRFCYRFVDDMVDIGPCMQKLLLRQHHHARCATLTPWALTESERIPVPDPEIRRKLFGEAKIGVLYSGTIGQAHNVSPFIALARYCRARGLDVAFCFAGAGNCYQEQLAEISEEDINIRIARFASEADLQQRLAAADVHMVSLRKGWEGVVVPSKFFGALATGRPVLFSGPEDSCITQWCREYQIGAVLSDKTIDLLAELLQNPEKLDEWKQRAFACYQKFFSRQIVIDRWLQLLHET